MDAQMKKGVVELCLLYVISKKESYGYALIGEITSLFPNLPERTVYAILRRLLSGGYTETFTKDESGGPPRKYYRITEKGQGYLEGGIAAWREIRAAVDALGVETA